MNLRATDGKEVRAFLGEFQRQYAAHLNGATYLIRRPKDAVLVKMLLETYPPERLALMATELLTVQDDWIGRTDRGIGILTCKASWLDARVCERAAHAAEDWFEECKRIHAGACELNRWRHHERKQTELMLARERGEAV